MSKLATPLTVQSEDDAWSALRSLLDNKIDPDDIDFAASSFAWAGVTINAKGPKYHSSMPASFMRGLVDFQDNFLRSSALILKDSSYITKLSNETRADLDLVFVVKEGSTGIEAFLREQIQELIKKWETNYQASK